MQVVAMIHQQGDAFGVSFPDFPGCTTVAKDPDSAVAKAAEVLAFHAEGLAEDGPLPQPRTLSQLRSDPNFISDSKDAVLAFVPYEPPARATRINMTVEEGLLARIDQAAEALGETRSRYFATAARLRMGMKDDLQAGTRADWIWLGYLKLGLVSCPISLVPAFKVNERPQDTYTMDILGFVPRAEIGIGDLQCMYYVVPSDNVGLEAFAVIREAMRNKNVVGISRVVLRKRERPIVLEPFGKGLRAMTLWQAHEVRDEAEVFAGIGDIALPREMLELAEHIVDTKAAHFRDPALQELFKQTPQRKKPVVEQAPSNVINLMDALRRSIAEDERPQPRGRRRAE